MLVYRHVAGLPPEQALGRARLVLVKTKSLQGLWQWRGGSVARAPFGQEVVEEGLRACMTGCDTALLMSGLNRSREPRCLEVVTYTASACAC